MNRFNRRASLYGVILLLGLVLTLLISEGAARWSYRSSLSLTPPEWPKRELPEFLLVVNRRPEKMKSDDPIPHRASVSALYKRIGDKYSKISPDLPVRSTSSSQEHPTDEDLQTIVSYLKRENADKYTWGYASVPCGLWALKPDKDGAGQLRYAVLSWKTRSSTLELPHPQVIRAVRLSESTDQSSETSTTLKIMDSPPGEESVRSFKDSVFVHGTVTREWSHVDSQGCITYQTSSRGGQAKSDYETLCGILEEHGLHQNDPNLGLLIRDASSEDSENAEKGLGMEINLSKVRDLVIND